MSESHFLRKLFDEFKAGGVRYAVMRNFAGLPWSTGGSDLDLLIGPEDRHRARSAVHRAIASMGAVVIGEVAWSQFLKVFVVGRPSTADEAPWGVRLDINVGVAFRGVDCVATDAVWDCVVEKDGVAVLPEPVAATLGVLKDLLNNETLNDRYLPGARLAFETDASTIDGVLAPLGTAALSVLRRVVRESSSGDAATCSRELRSAARAQALAHHPLRYCANLFARRASHVKRYFRPQGIVVVVMGPDGVGKSTVIEGLRDAFHAATHGAVEIQHLKPGLLPPLAALKGRSRVGSPLGVAPHASTPSGLLGSVARMAYYTLDYILGYWLRVRPAIARQPTIWIFDRYAFDMALDPRRFRIGPYPRLARAFVSICPKPHLVLCLTAPAGVVRGRKEELSPAEVERQLQSLSRFARMNSHAVLVSTDVPVPQAKARCVAAVTDFLAARARELERT